MKKCPPGVICINNYIISTIVIVIIILLFAYSNFTQNIIVNNKPSEKIVIQKEENNGFNNWLPSWLPSYPYTNLPNDVLLNPYVPPLRDERYLMQPLTFAPTGVVPINVSTNVGAVNTNYRQMGFLTSLNDKDKIIPLMGRPLYTSRDKWQYYTISDQRNSIKLPILRRGKSCTNEYGCDRLYTGENVYIEGLNKQFKVTLYENDTIQYLPFL
jgi:hypothetical protein